MIRKRSTFWTVLFSFFPGAGHMFMGFMKQGLSLMAAALGLILVSFSLRVEPLLVMMPLIWFYSFFDALNKSSLPDEDFYTLEDSFMFSLDKLAHSDWSFLRSHQRFIGWLAVVIGSSMVLSNLWYLFSEYFPEYQRIVWRLGDSLPRMLISLFIIALGVRLIMGKRRETAALPPHTGEAAADE